MKLIYIVGNSDIQFYNNKEFQRILSRDFKNITKKIYEEIDKENINIENEIIISKGEKYAIPILYDLLQRIIEVDRYKITEIILFVTDQNNEKYSVQDTIYAGEVLKWFIKKVYGIREISIKEISHNPSDYSKNLAFFSDYCKSEINNGEDIIIQLTTGTPAMYISLMLGLFRNGIKPRIYYIGPRQKQEEQRKVEYIKDLYQIEIEKEKKIFKELLNAYYYHKILENNKFMFINKFITRMEKDLLLLKKILNFEIEEARELLNETIIIEKKYENILLNIRNDEESKILLLYNILNIYIKRENYISALSVCFSLMDNILKQLFIKKSNINTGGDYVNNFKNWIEDRQDLKSFLEKNDIRIEPTFKTYEMIFRYYEWEVPFFLKEEERGSIESLRNARNNGPLAHGLRGLTPQEIELLKNFIGKIRNFITKEYRFSSKEMNFIDLINEDIWKFMRKGIYEEWGLTAK